jgi:hypothetical protein
MCRGGCRLLPTHLIQGLESLSKHFPASPSGGGAGAGSYCRDSFKHIHVALDTRLPASYGPGSNYPPQHLPTAVHTYLEPLAFHYPHSRGGYVQDERYIAIEHMDVRRDCVSFARDQYAHEPIVQVSCSASSWSHLLRGGLGSQHP